MMKKDNFPPDNNSVICNLEMKYTSSQIFKFDSCLIMLRTERKTYIVFLLCILNELVKHGNVATYSTSLLFLRSQIWLRMVPAGSQLHSESKWLWFGVSLTRKGVDSLRIHSIRSQTYSEIESLWLGKELTPNWHHSESSLTPQKYRYSSDINS